MGILGDIIFIRESIVYNNRKFLNKNWTEFNGSTIIDARDYTNDNCSTFKEYCCYVPVYIDTRAYTIIELFERFYIKKDQ
jgi:hypothetical protein